MTVKGQGRAINWIRAHVAHDGDDCLAWPMCRDDKGYGHLGWLGRRYKAHRLMCEFAHGPSPEGKPFVGHSCGNGHLGCVNPKHLSWTDNSQNQLDRTAHGRRTGQPWGRAGKLTAEEVAEIQAQRGITPIRKLAERFGVKRGAIDYWHKRAKEGIGYRGDAATDWFEINRRSAAKRVARR